MYICTPICMDVYMYMLIPCLHCCPLIEARQGQMISNAVGDPLFQDRRVTPSPAGARKAECVFVCVCVCVCVCVRVCVCVCVICHISKLCGALQLLCIRSTCSATPIRRPHFDRCQQLAAARPTVSSMIACAEQVPAHQKPTCWWVTQVRQQKTDDGERVSNLVHTGPRNMRLYPACAAQARQQTPRRLRPCVQYVLILLKAR